MIRAITTAIAFGLVFAASSVSFGQGKDEAYEAINTANDLARRGAITRSIPHYEKGLKLDPLGYTLAYFNLAEVWRAKGRDSKAALFYTLYLRHGSDDTTLRQAKQAVAELKKESWGTLTVTGSPLEEATITIDGFLLSKGEEIDQLAIPPGDYTIEVSAVDHIAEERTVEIEKKEEEVVTYGLEEMTFYGTIMVNVSEVEGAEITIHAGPSDKTRVVGEFTAPMKEPFKVEEGRHFVEVKAKDYNRWIRNVSVNRESNVVVDVNLTRALPAEIRRD